MCVSLEMLLVFCISFYLNVRNNDARKSSKQLAQKTFMSITLLVNMLMLQMLANIKIID